MEMIGQKLYNGVRLLGQGPCEPNVARLDMSFVPLLSYMGNIGMQVDLSHFSKLEVELTRDMDRITEAVRAATGYYCNLSSPEQKSDLLFKKLGLKQARPKMTRSGDRESVADEILTAIQHQHPVVPMLQEYAEIDKLRGTYVVPMPKLAKRTKFGQWRMYPNLGHTRVPSGRINCKEPNLLAMPNRTERGRDIRKGFITDPGWVYVSVDLSQIEVRCAAHSSKDPNLIKVYQNEEDVYSDFATTAFQLKDERYQDENGEWKYPTVDKREHRFPAKTCVLASIYDVTAIGLVEQLPVICSNCGLEATKHTCTRFRSLWNEDKAQGLINSFYQRYSGIMKDRKRHHAMVRKYGFAWDAWGRILHCAAIHSVLDWVVSEALREVGNFPYQSFATGIFKLGSAAAFDDFDHLKMFDVVHPLLPVHDELVMESREDMAEEIGMHVVGRFSNVCRLDVPLKAGMESAESWGQLNK